MRELSVQARKTREALKEQAKAERAAAMQAAAESRARIAEDRAALEKAVAELEAENRGLEADIQDLTDTLAGLAEAEETVGRKLAETDSTVQELVGVIRVTAKDIDALIEQIPRTALTEAPAGFLEAVAEANRFPGMAEIRAMAEGLWRQIQSTGEVVLREGTIVDRAGREAAAEILFLGPFTAAYRLGQEEGYLSHTQSGTRLFALSRLPPNRVQDRIARYMAGDSAAVDMDITQGAALRQLVHQMSLAEQIPHGGPIVWPILAILAAGIVIILERCLFLVRKRLNADRLVRRIDDLSRENDWEGCAEACDRHRKKPVARVLRAGLMSRRMRREEMENALQEAILKEIPPMERFLSTLGMLAAIAPLLGLLGTVTGMIDTFHVITLHGAGDPRLMSGGISEALVTTMLGLSVAIPLMLCHTLLNRAVDRHIGEMEEKAVSLVNLIHKHRGAA